MGNVFRFKQFEVDQTGCSMKINTDGVLIGAYAKQEDPVAILDIGTGTGVIAMMLAQRFCQASVDAVEIDPQAARGAAINFQNSPFADRIQHYEGSFIELKTKNEYDLIVSNPPFYTNSLHNPDERKKTARHTDIHFFEQLLDFAQRSLRDGGTLVLILPPDLAEEVTRLAEQQNLFLRDTLAIFSYKEDQSFRRIISLQKNRQSPLLEDKLVIYKERGVYSEDYRSLLKPFFLAF